MGGLRKYMPITWITSLVGSLALIGTPLFVGLLLEGQHHRGGAREPPAGRRASPTSRSSPACSSPRSTRSACTSSSSTARSASTTSPSRGEHDHDARSRRRARTTPHESPWVVTLPLVLLAIPSVVIGYLTIGPMLFGDFFKDSIFVDAARHPAMDELAEEFHGAARDGDARPDGAAVLAGAGRRRRPPMSSTCQRPTSRRRSRRALAFINRLLDNKYYFDWFNEHVLAAGARWLGKGLWKGGDVGADRRRHRQRLGARRRRGGRRRRGWCRRATCTGTRW